MNHDQKFSEEFLKSLNIYRLDLLEVLKKRNKLDNSKKKLINENKHNEIEVDRFLNDIEKTHDLTKNIGYYVCISQDIRYQI